MKIQFNKKMKKKILIRVCIAAGCILLTANCFSQDYRFSQYYENPLRLNPAMMGANSDMKFMLGYRSQWSNIEKGFTTMSFTALFPVFLDNGGKLDIGVNAINDKAGAFKTTDAALAIDYNMEIAADQNLCLSLLAGYTQKSLDVSNLTFDNQYVLGSYQSSNPSNESVLNKEVSYADAGCGLVWYMNPARDKSKLNAFLGVSGYHINKPNQSFTGKEAALPIRVTYIGGIKIMGEKKIDVAPNIRMTQQNANTEMSAGVSVDYSVSDAAKLVIGASYRRSDAVAFLVGMEFNKFTFAYSYDAVTSTLNNVSANALAHEITLALKFHKGPDAVKPNPFRTF